MGKGDMKTARGKRARGTYGKTRQRPSAPKIVAPQVKSASKAKVAKAKSEDQPAAKKAKATKTTKEKPQDEAKEANDN